MKRLAIFGLAALLAVTACGSDDSSQADNQAAAAPAANVAAPAVNASTEAAAPAAAPAYTLAGDGLRPGLAFGTPRNDAVQAARAAFGTPTGREHNEECGEGPMDFISFRGLQLGFNQGRLTGWSLSGSDPALRSARGLAIGAPRSVLGEAEIDRESTLGLEFFVDDIGGLLDEGGERIEALWAGDVCQFR